MRGGECELVRRREDKVSEITKVTRWKRQLSPLLHTIHEYLHSQTAFQVKSHG